MISLCFRLIRELIHDNKYERFFPEMQEYFLLTTGYRLPIVNLKTVGEDLNFYLLLDASEMVCQSALFDGVEARLLLRQPEYLDDGEAGGPQKL